MVIFYRKQILVYILKFFSLCYNLYMLMSDEYAAKLKAELEIENKIRENFVRQWVNGEITGLSGAVNEPRSNNVEQERE